jgi:L-threonylcarbamoyladenylate synthase
MEVSITQAQNLLQEGAIVGIATETVYGLAALLSNEKAVKKIFELKGRPANNPLIIHVANAEQVKQFAPTLPPQFHQLAQAFWPGPLTLVIPVDTKIIPEIARAGLPTAAFRVPNHPLTLELIKKVGPIVMPSANLSGKPSATDAEHVERDFGHDFPVLNGGPCSHGVESTILLFNEQRWTIGRLGAISSELLEPILGYLPETLSITKTPLCPGQLYRHYSPLATLHLLKEFPENFTGTLLGYHERTYPKGATIMPLGSINNPETVANNLYRVLRELDKQNLTEAWVDINIPQTGLWKTILERLKKAAGGSAPCTPAKGP